MLHIRMFPAEESHYSRTCNPNRRYLSPELTIAKMYDLYKSWCQDNNTRTPSECTYRDALNSRFNLGLGTPKSDTCGLCNAVANSASDHKLRARSAFMSMKDTQMAADGSGVAYVTFYMQKTLPLPMLSTCVAFYLRQIWLYNVEQGASRQYFHIWSEDPSTRGCDEMGSALLTFVNTVDVKEEVLVAWSDSCTEQNEDFFILSLWQYLFAKKQFQVIHHKFPEPGHSYQQTALSTRLRVTLRLHLLQVLIHQILMRVHAYLNIVNTSVTLQRLPNNTLRHSFLPFSVVTAVDVAVTKFQNLSSVKMYNG